MPFSHHSHSGQFCHHAKDTLEEVVKTAISKGMQTLVMTEHMPRDASLDSYPEEVEAGVTTEVLFELFNAYYAEAGRLQTKYTEEISILVGFETEWIRPSSKEGVARLLMRYPVDTMIGSVHHVHGVPIDFDRPMYERAREISGGSDEALFADYFDAQFAMLEAVRPPIVGHFDLIRRESDNRNGDWKRYVRVWPKILRNLHFISAYGGMLEINTAALRLGMSEPYPRAEACQASDKDKEFMKMNGKFVLSDDSHGIAQVGVCYDRIPKFLQETGIESLMVLEKGLLTNDSRFSGVSAREVATNSLEEHELFTGSACVTPVYEAAIGHRRNRSAATTDRLPRSTSDEYFYRDDKLMELYEASLATCSWPQADRYKVFDRLTPSLEPGLRASLVVREYPRYPARYLERLTEGVTGWPQRRH